MIESRHKGNLLLGWDQIGQRLVFLGLASLSVDPLQSPFALLVERVGELDDLAHLGIQEGVSDDFLLLLELLGEPFALEGHVVEVETQRS